MEVFQINQKLWEGQTELGVSIPSKLDIITERKDNIIHTNHQNRCIIIENYLKRLGSLSLFH